jgi:23S rRNA (adenine2503-C2)-methyltransferase
MVSIHDIGAVEEVRHRLRIEPNHLRQLKNVLYKHHRPIETALRELPQTQREPFAAAVDFRFLEADSRHDSAIDGATKLVFRTRAGLRLETVILRIATGRTSLCVSSQVGCAVRCAFCATGQMAMASDLTRDEILDQVVQANAIIAAEGRAVRNVVFMGMGEPLLNEDAVYPALDALAAPAGFNLTPARLLVSTVGIPDAMVRCATRYPRLGMALSLHSARQEVRERIIPLARRYPLDRLRQAIVDVVGIQGQPLMIEYLLLGGVNDGDADAAALIEYLRGLPVSVNLIPYNPIDEIHGFVSTSKTRRCEFGAILRAAGFVVRVRYSLGSDIAAACGQLVRRSAQMPSPATR